VGQRLGLDHFALAGIMASLANSVAMFPTFKDMGRRGKVASMAFAACASAVFGDHLGYTAASDQDLIFPVTVGKLSGGLAGFLVALIATRSYPSAPKPKPQTATAQGAPN
jgi:ethanolamine transporter